MTLLKHEWKLNLKSLLVWTACLGFACFGCLLLFDSLEDTMGQMADAYARMGSFSTALGLDRISVSTMEGFYATEVALMYGIGGAMFAAMTGAAAVSKEEEGHTSEFLYTLPFGRDYIIFWKYAAMVCLIFLFNCICLVWVLAGFLAAGEAVPWREFVLYHGAQLLMHLEVGSVCFLVSALSSKKQTGAALGFAVLLYMMDLMCRIVPDIEALKYVTPYYFSNATDIFTEGSVDGVMAGISLGVTAMSVCLAAVICHKRDIKP